jgi:transcriptional regulator with XRE-family HTH domain
MDLVQTMKSRRKTLGISQQDLAEIAEVSLATVKDIERGRGNPSLRTVQKILDVLGMEINYQVRKVVP